MKSPNQAFLQWLRRFTCVVVLFTPASLIAAEQYALLVGIEEYSTSIPPQKPLKGCIKDVDRVRTLLEKTFGFPEANITTLTNASATAPGIIRGLLDLAERAKPGDAVFFYYTGHGAQVPDTNDGDETEDHLDEVFVTPDFNLKKPETWLLDDHIGAALSRIKTNRVLVVLDTCNAGTATRSGAGAAHSVKRADLGLSGLEAGRVGDSRVLQPRGTAAQHALIAACGASEIAVMGTYDGADGSLFTLALSKIVPNRLSVPVGQLGSALKPTMEAIDPQNGRLQTPQFEGAVNQSLAKLIGPEGQATGIAEAEETPMLLLSENIIPSDFQVDLILDKDVYVVGDIMTVAVESSRDGYLKLYYVDTRGNVSLVFPNQFQQDNQIVAGKPVRIPETGAPFRLRMKEPEGTELLIAEVTTQKLPDPPANLENNVAAGPRGPFSFRELVHLGDGGDSNQRANEGGASIGRAVRYYQIRKPGP